MHFQLTTARYQGPIEKLVELIDEKKLPITEVNLAEVTADFLSYLETLETQTNSLPEEGSQRGEDRAALTALLADFLVVASRLILIKSKVLLPSLELSKEEEEDIHDLEARVRLYRELKNLQPHIRASWEDAPQMGTHDFFFSEEIVFYPPARLGPEDLRKTAARLAGELSRIMRPLRSVTGVILHLKEKIEEVFERVKAGAFSFGQFHRGRSRGEAVVLFLAVLHLIKSQLVRVTQASHFSDINIAKREKDGDNADETGDGRVTLKRL
ncbi:MAG: segregation/condensation protein A [Candidatus Brennerbacteria bacterium]|nr:segregation/condensation protein A [Candidatus Brennerbacteria bacterium]